MPSRLSPIRKRERELRKEGGKSLLAYVKGVGPYLIQIGPLPFGRLSTMYAKTCFQVIGGTAYIHGSGCSISIHGHGTLSWPALITRCSA